MQFARSNALSNVPADPGGGQPSAPGGEGQVLNARVELHGVGKVQICGCLAGQNRETAIATPRENRGHAVDFLVGDRAHAAGALPICERLHHPILHEDADDIARAAARVQILVVIRETQTLPEPRLAAGGIHGNTLHGVLVHVHLPDLEMLATASRELVLGRVPSLDGAHPPATRYAANLDLVQEIWKMGDDGALTCVPND